MRRYIAPFTTIKANDSSSYPLQKAIGLINAEIQPVAADHDRHGDVVT